ncbi:MAG: alpha/beta hydrolase [Salinarimonas sp.]|nr:alpha/beta hydrolase [Salinarimonas sp.]
MVLSRVLSVSVVAGIVSGCANFGFSVANSPLALFEGDVVRGVSYGAEPWEKLDIYTPPGIIEINRPVVVFFYGGRWTTGSRENYGFVGNALAAQGFVTVIPDYRKYPQVRFPAFVEDGAKAVNWVHENIEEFNGLPDTLFLAGHSAGAHIAALLVSDERYLRNEGNALDNIRGFVGLAGPYDFTPEVEDVQEIFGPPSNYPQMQVTTFIDGTEPPMLLMYGDADETVERYNLDRLAGRIEEMGGESEQIIYPGLNHIEIVGAFSWFWRNKAPVIQDMTDFINRKSE